MPGLIPIGQGRELPAIIVNIKMPVVLMPRLPGYSYRNLAKRSVDELKEEIWGDKDVSEEKEN